PGPPTRIEAIELPGASATRPSAAAAISGLRAGRVVTPALLADGRERLVGSGLFSSVGDPRILSGKEPGGARVVIPVEENTASRFEGALGVAKGGGVTGLIDLGLGNIAGTGRTAGARWAGLGDGRSTYALRYREPALLGKPIDGSFALDGDVADSLFTQTRWALGFGGRPMPRSRASLGFAHTGSTYSGYGRGSSETWSMEGQLEWQGLAPQLSPTRGVAATLHAEAGHRTERYPGIPEAKRPLYHGAALLEAARSLGGPRVLYGALRAEQVSLGGGDFPAEELLYLGGSEGLRGHRDRAFAGNRIFGLNLEQRWLTDARGGRAYLFLDAARHALDAPLSSGVLAASGGSPTLARTELSDGWELGYGAGIRTPVAAGVAGLELGLSPGAALREATIHIHYASHW
ncbi:MAG: BamA/TamA family outer membrane protein, partial [Candidatus Eiseniibacteriota bacterium]